MGGFSGTKIFFDFKSAHYRHIRGLLHSISEFQSKQKKYLREICQKSLANDTFCNHERLLQMPKVQQKVDVQCGSNWQQTWTHTEEMQGLPGTN